MWGKTINLSRISLLFLILFSSSEFTLAQNKSKWRIKNRLQATYEFDNNIRETPSQSFSRIEDSSLRFLFHSQAVHSSKKSRVLISYRGGLQSYFENSIENKLINEFGLNATLKLNKSVLGVRSSGRLKNYLNDVLDYVTGSVELFLQPPSISKFRNEIAVQISGVNYQNFSTFDYSSWQLKWKLARKLTSRLSWSFELAGTQINYLRTVPVESVPESSVLPFVDVNLNDLNYQARMQLNYTKSFLINLNYTFQVNDSKVARYTYIKHQVTLLFGIPLTESMWLRGYGAAQLKNYDDESIDFFPIDIDTEKEESNFFVLDLSKDLNPSLTALVRLAFYNNESIERGRFYRKSLLTLGFDYRF
ncbi:MAG: hypothetical protein ACE5IR_14925 [bacterium]